MAKVYGNRCSSGACFLITEVDGKFVFTSTIEGNYGAVIYTADEVATFLKDVKDGKYEALLADARGETLASTV